MIESQYVWLHNKISGSEEENFPSAGRWHKKVREVALGLCAGKHGWLLEVGCAEGLFLRKISLSSSFKVIGIDNNFVKIKLADNELRNVRGADCALVSADALNLPFKSRVFDLVICINTVFNLGTLAAARGVLGEMARTCRENGRIIFDFRNSANMFLKIKYKLAEFYDPTIKRDKLPLCTFSLKQIMVILEELGLRVLNKKFIGFPGNGLAPIILIEAEKC
jgi:ubiquinone/menaquinone biosynthesis C-methylase UbiE